MTAKSAKDLLMAAKSQIEEVSIEEASNLANNGHDYVLVDVRETQEFDAAHIPGSIHAPRGLLEFHLDMQSGMGNAALDTDKTMIMVCGSGGRAALATATALQMGKNAVCMTGGFKAWKEAGYKVE